MRRAEVYQQGRLAGHLEEIDSGRWRFLYVEGYDGPPISLSMPVSEREYVFAKFPPVFEGLLPEGLQLDVMLRKYKLDRHDLFGQLVLVGQDVVGSLSVVETQ